MAGTHIFRVSTVELDRGGVSYTIDTLLRIADQRPNVELFFLLGGDAVADLAKWREPERICALALPLVVRRHGSPEPCFEMLSTLLSAERLSLVRQAAINMPLIELSSSDLRRRAAEGKSLRFRTPAPWRKY